MPRLSRDDAWRVVSALRQLTVLDPVTAADLDVARVINRLSHRACQSNGGSMPLPARLHNPDVAVQHDKPSTNHCRKSR